ncbi:lipoprotein-anchoring transpeptidase ErfK/SrfK [Kitasatospora sp. MAP12-15]|uniref:L,D-transpeptidase n=1 Tax=unclassified Kitasatospora TaxID=2633591 RepID=UPI002475C3D4|nr:Ig-like domain-containing protein [Kitasatospora sp. MAP12-44]MDH6112871.1 lipoprotein-anchoring transpeptidase ErfK/SrfK [Kitasatospora sp. MAP12-44]
MKSKAKAIRVVLAVGGLLLATACSSGGGSGTTSGAGGTGGGTGGAAGQPGTSSSAASKSTAVVDIEPKDGATNVAPAGALKVSVASGKLTQVTVTGSDGSTVAGTLSPDGTSWVPAAGLAVSATYKVAAQSTDAKGVVATTTSSFTTLTPTKTAGSSDNIVTGSTYGVGMIIQVDFGQAVKNKAAVAQAITVTASDGSVVKGHWFNEDHWFELRPQAFWKPGTKVSIHFGLKSTEISPGIYGSADRDESFTIGRSQVSTVDSAAHEMTVVTDGRAPRVIPVTTGASNPANWATYNGTMVIERKEGTVEMKSASVPGLGGTPYDEKVPDSMRLTDTGTYVHGNYWAAGAYGHENVSHGCIGLQDVEGGSPDSVAGKMYADSIVGDVVIVMHSTGQQVDPGNGLSGWNIAWANW